MNKHSFVNFKTYFMLLVNVYCFQHIMRLSASFGVSIKEKAVICGQVPTTSHMLTSVAMLT